MFSFIAIVHAYITLKIIAVGEGGEDWGMLTRAATVAAAKNLKKKFTCVETREHGYEILLISLTVITCVLRQCRYCKSFHSCSC